MAEWKSTIHPLAHPIRVGEVSYVAITLREPDVDALELMEGFDFKEKDADGVNTGNVRNPTVNEMRQIIEAISDMPQPAIRKLHAADFGRICEVAVPLLSVGLTASDAPNNTTASSPPSPTI